MSKSPAEPVTAAGGIVFRFTENKSEPEVLMIFRRDVWDLPKGKLEEDESIPMCAVREVAEEVGSRLPSIVEKVGETYHEYPEDGKVMGKTTHWFSMIFTRQEEFAPQQNEGIEAVKWKSLSEAIADVGYDNLREILQKFSK